jgi:hypothetical protein
MQDADSSQARIKNSNWTVFLHNHSSRKDYIPSKTNHAWILARFEKKTQKKAAGQTAFFLLLKDSTAHFIMPG